MLEKLNRMFGERYFAEIEHLNVNIYKAAVDDNGHFEVPIPALSSGGFTDLPNTGVVNLNPPARASVKNKKMKATKVIYRVAISLSEAEIAANKPEYFNYLFDSLVAQAVSNYGTKYGPSNKVRFGETYITAQRPDGAAFLTQWSPGPGSEADDQIEFRLYGHFASEEEA